MLTPEARREVEHKLREGKSVNRIAQVHRVHHSVIRRVARELEDLETRTETPILPKSSFS